MNNIVGITGGIASGKSNVCNIIREEGYVVLSCDEVNARLLKKGEACYNAICKEYKDLYLNQDGEIDKAKLARDLFSNVEMKRRMDEITHPLIMKEIINDAKKIDGIVFAEIPLLFEGHFEDICCATICVFLKKKLQVERLMFREGIDEDYALRKIHSQMDLYLKKELADYVIDSKGTFEETKTQVLKIIDEIRKEKGNGSY